MFGTIFSVWTIYSNDVLVWLEGSLYQDKRYEKNRENIYFVKESYPNNHPSEAYVIASSEQCLAKDIPGTYYQISYYICSDNDHCYSSHDNEVLHWK